MAVGYGVKNLCFETSAKAVDYYWESQPVTTADAFTSNTYFYQYPVKLTYWKLFSNRCTQASGSISCNGQYFDLPSPAISSCTYTPPVTNSEAFVDGNLLGWGVVAAMVAAWAVHVMRPPLSRGLLYTSSQVF